MPPKQPPPLSRRERPAKPALSRAAVIETALTILQKEGLERVTMRSIAAALDTGPASIYVYVRNTQDLHEQLLEALSAELPSPKPSARWRRDLVRVAEAYLELLMRYSEIAQLALSTIPTGPNALKLLDTVAGLLVRGGANIRAASWGVDLVLHYVTATAVEHSHRRGFEDAELERLKETFARLDTAAYPHLGQLGDELVSGEGRERFRWGLDVVVNGILQG